MTKSQAWKQYFEGMRVEWPFTFSLNEVLLFSKLSGDYNPVHLDNEFAQSKGFDSLITYGLLLATQMSRLIGQELPDKNVIMTGIQMDFMKPSFPEDRLFFSADLINKSDSTFSLEFKCDILRDQEKLCRGKVKALWIP